MSFGDVQKRLAGSISTGGLGRWVHFSSFRRPRDPKLTDTAGQACLPTEPGRTPREVELQKGRNTVQMDKPKESVRQTVMMEATGRVS